MFQRVSEKLKPDLENSMMVGDSATDLIAAHAVGIKNLYLLSSEKVQKEQKSLEDFRAVDGRFSFELLSSLDKVNF
ncbi:D,D-heptose 1,7-bisphosphate phosphatase [compost metagenome]